MTYISEKPKNPDTAVSRDSNDVTSLSLGSAFLGVGLILRKAVPRLGTMVIRSSKLACHQLE